MATSEQGMSELLTLVAAHLDIPESYYRKAAARHKSVGEWLNRPESTLLRFQPNVRPQGSFRYGTVIRPLDPGNDYDLDNICLLANIAVTEITQEQLKAAYGHELRLYARAQGMLNPLEEHNRCWRLQYADEVGFHLDTLPCLAASTDTVAELIRSGVLDRLASAAVAITDRRNPNYSVLTSDWLRSNPRGFARWFESRAALGRETVRAGGIATAKTEDVPPYEWKTTLQRSIQLLKRHRDVMFRAQCDLAPISMIITNLSAHAYSGERDLWLALEGIVAGMPRFVNRVSPRVPNPTLPSEDYADKWRKKPQLERNFNDWLATVSVDLAKLRDALEAGTAAKAVKQLFDIDLTVEESRSLAARFARRSVAAPAIIIASAPKPWGHNRIDG